MTCAGCIAEWYKKSKTCPTCVKESEFRNLNRNLKNQLEAKGYTFTCKQGNCREVFTYNDAYKHLSTCQLVCPLKCAAKIKISGKQGMKKHYEEDCLLA